MIEKNKRIIIIILSVLAGVFLTACEKTVQEVASKPVKSVDRGLIEDYTYTNDYFEFSIDLPYDWYAMSQKEMQAVAKQGGRMITGNQQNLKAALEASEPNYVYMFMVFEQPPGTPGSFNPSITCIGEKTSMYPGIKDGEDYFMNMKKLLAMGNVQVDFDGEIGIEDLGGQEFHYMHSEMQFGGFTISSDYYSAIIKGYAIGFVLSYADEDQEQVLMDSIASVQFYE